MYRLHYAPATASQAVHWMLIHIGAPFEAVRLDTQAGDQKTPAYLKLNPRGTVPTLEVDGAPVSETAAILMLLAERHPEAALAPAVGAPGRAEWLYWMVHLANAVMPPFRLWFYPDDLGGEAPAVREALAGQIAAVWDRLDGLLSDGRSFLLGERLTTVDMLATMLMRWSRNMPRPATDWPNLKVYVDRMRALPSLREVHAREGVTDWIDG